MTNIWDRSVAQHKQQIEAHIIESMVELVAERGMSEVSMSELAKRAGVSRKTLYNYFPDVQQVLVAWMKAELVNERERLAKALEGLEDPIEKLSEYVRISLESCAQRQHHAGLEAAMGAEAAMSHEAWESVSEQFSQTEALLREILEDGVKQGAFKKGLDLDTHQHLIVHLLGSLHHLMGERDSDPERIRNAILDLVINGIGA